MHDTTTPPDGWSELVLLRAGGQMYAVRLDDGDVPIEAVKIPDVEQMLNIQHQPKREASMRTVLRTLQQ